MPRTKGKDLVLEYLGSLIMVKGEERCLGYLIHREDKGWTYDADYGRVDVSKEHAEIHNRELTKALLNGLEDCKIGEWGTFYLHEPEKQPAATVELAGDNIAAEANLPPAQPDAKWLVKTFTGEVVSDDVTLHGWNHKWVTFRRNNMTFRGKRPRGESQLLRFQRIS